MVKPFLLHNKYIFLAVSYRWFWWYEFSYVNLFWHLRKNYVWYTTAMKIIPFSVVNGHLLLRLPYMVLITLYAHCALPVYIKHLYEKNVEIPKNHCGPHNSNVGSPGSHLKNPTENSVWRMNSMTYRYWPVLPKYYLWSGLNTIVSNLRGFSLTWRSDLFFLDLFVIITYQYICAIFSTKLGQKYSCCRAYKNFIELPTTDLVFSLLLAEMADYRQELRFRFKV